MDKKELIERVASRAGVERSAAEAIIGHALDEIGDALGRGDSVTIAKFGSFEIRHRGARKGRNPQTGEEIEIAASKSPAFKPAAALKRRVSD